MMLIDAEIERAGLELSAASGRAVRQILRDSGFSEKEIDKVMFEAMEGVFICGVPVHSFEDRLFFIAKQNDFNGLS